MADEQIDFGEEDYGGNQKTKYHGGGAISALAEDEMINEDDEYDDLYNDVNVGEGFLQMQRNQASLTPTGGSNMGFQPPKTSFPESRAEATMLHEAHVPGGVTEAKYVSSGLRFPEQKSGLAPNVGPPPTTDVSQKAQAPEMTHGSQAGNMEYQGSLGMPQKVGPDSLDTLRKVPGPGESATLPSLNPGAGSSRGIPQMPGNQTTSSANINVNRPIINENQIRPAVENGNAMLFVGELHWWTTDAELESVLTQYGKVKEIKFFDERASGKSKGYCQVEFYEPTAAAACKEGMNGYHFNGRACVVAFATPQSIKQMAANYMNKTQVQAQSQPQGRIPMSDAAGRGNGTNYPGGDVGRNYGRGGWGGRGGQGMPNKGPAGGPGRGRGGPMGAKNMIGNAPGGGNGAVGGNYGQGGLAGPAFGGPPAGMMHPQAMMGPGFDPTYMGRGPGYGGFSGPAFPGMIPPFPAVNPMGLAGVAPHVNPAFFGRGMASNGMGMMGPTGMDGPHAGMWTDSSMGGWGGEEHGRRTRESSYGGEDNASEYGYGEASHDKGVRSSGASREKERGPERDWSGSSERRHRDEREHDRDRYDRDNRHKEEKDSYRDYHHKERDRGYEDDWDRGQPSRSRSRSRAMPEEDHKSRSRGADYGKRRRMPSE